MKLAFLDTETTGLDPRIHDVWEVAVILREPGLADEEYVWQVRPDLTHADPKALEIGRYAERYSMPAGADAVLLSPSAPPFKLALPEFLYDLQDVLKDAVIAGSNPAFDDRFLTALLQRHGRKIQWHYRTVDVITLAVGWLTAHGKHEGLELPWRSYQVSETAGVPRPTGDVAHTALGDARWVRDLYDAVTGSAP